MSRLQPDPEALPLDACADDLATATALGVDVDRVRRAVVHLLWDDFTVGEAVTAVATLRASGSGDEARAVWRALLDQCVGMGGVPQGGQRAPGHDRF